MWEVPVDPPKKVANEISDTNTSNHIPSFSVEYPKDIGPTYVSLPDKIAFLSLSLSIFFSLRFV
jgi:hypothetical protein